MEKQKSFKNSFGLTPDNPKEFGEGVTADEVMDFIWQSEEFLADFLRGKL